MSKNIVNTSLLIQKVGTDKLVSKADKFMLFILWAHLPIAGAIAPYSYGSWKQGLIASLVINTIATISYLTSRGTFGHRLLNGLLLLSYSVILISVQHGRLEMHFHVFASLPLLILYRDWRIIPPAVILTAVHHAAFNYCQTNNIKILGMPLVVFNYGTGWEIVFVHSLFVIIQASVLIYYAILLKQQHEAVIITNKNLEAIVDERTQKLRQEKEKIETYKKTLDQVAMTAVADSDGNVLDINKKFENISEYSIKELTDNNYNILKSGIHDKAFFQAIVTKLKSGSVWRGEIHEKTKSGQSYWVDSAIAPIKNKDGSIKNYMTIRFDITDRKRNAETVLKQQAKIVSQSKFSALGEMAGGIAHEINNPLAIISATMYTIRKMIKKNMIETQAFKDALDDIDKTIIRITKIVLGLRNVSRDTTTEDFDTCKVKEVIDDALSLSSEKFKSHGIKVDIIDKGDIKDTQVQVLRIQLSQVILNLLSNSYDEIQLLEEKWITLSLDIEDKLLVIKVIDSGKGISEDVANKMFQPFFTTKDIGKGTGLGLSLSHSIITKHKGQFYIDSGNKNTCFVIKIPTQQDGDLA